MHYHFEKHPLVEWFHTIYWSSVSFKSDLSLLSDSTLLYSKITQPPVQIHTFHWSAEIWFYWLYTIISKNIPLLSGSIQSIDQLFHLHQTCPLNQTLNYNYPPVQVYTFHWLAEIWLYWFYTNISKNIPFLSDSILSINQLFRLHLICPYNQTLHYHFRKFLVSLCESIHYLIIFNLTSSP